MRHRHAAAAPLALLLLALVATPVAAGGVAVVIPGETGGAAVTAGKATTVSFTLLQHGVSPVDFGLTTVVFTDAATGTQYRATANPVGKTGTFEASFTYPRGGYWTWHVEHDGLLIQSEPVVVGIFETDGMVPAFSPGNPVDSTSTAMADQLDALRSERDGLRLQLQDLQASQATTASALAAAEGRPTVSTLVVGILAAAVLGILGGVGLVLVTNRSSGPRIREIAPGVPADAD